MENDQRYVPVEQALPAELPAITREEADRAIKKIMAHFGSKALGGPSMMYDARWSRPARRCWLSTKPTTGHYKGWGRLIHDASHIIFRKRHPSFRPHDGGHARLEREIAQFVATRCWLDGSLKAKAAPKPTAVDKLARIEARLSLWDSKRRRAETAIRKIKRQKYALTRRLTQYADARSVSATE
jgi:hypothetical protein